MNLIRYWRRIDSTLLMAVLGLGVICLLIIASATHANMDGQPGQYDFVMKQGIFFVGGLIIAGGSLYFDYRKLYRFVPILYGINASGRQIRRDECARGAALDPARPFHAAAFRICKDHHDHLSGKAHGA